MRSRYQNVERIMTVARRLEDLLQSVVFAGGAVIELLITDPAFPDVRPTIDIDVIVEVISLTDYYRLQQRLRISQGRRRDWAKRLFMDGYYVIFKTLAPLIFLSFSSSNATFADSKGYSLISGIMGISAARLMNSLTSFLATLATLFISFSSQR